MLSKMTICFIVKLFYFYFFKNIVMINFTFKYSIIQARRFKSAFLSFQIGPFFSCVTFELIYGRSVKEMWCVIINFSFQIGPFSFQIGLFFVSNRPFWTINTINRPNIDSYGRYLIAFLIWHLFRFKSAFLVSK